MKKGDFVYCDSCGLAIMKFKSDADVGDPTSTAVFCKMDGTDFKPLDPIKCDDCNIWHNYIIIEVNGNNTKERVAVAKMAL